jgi:hypothetical protein
VRSIVRRVLRRCSINKDTLGDVVSKCAYHWQVVSKKPLFPPDKTRLPRVSKGSMDNKPYNTCARTGLKRAGVLKVLNIPKDIPVSTITCGNFVDKSIANNVKYCNLLDD